jgi:hypothetical protein
MNASYPMGRRYQEALVGIQCRRALSHIGPERTGSSRVVAAMVRFACLAVMLTAASAAAAQQVTPASSRVTPQALTLFERDWVLMNWALKSFDTDRDILLSPAEAAAAARVFRQIADGNGDGRITPEEYRAARAFILARY